MEKSDRNKSTGVCCCTAALQEAVFGKLKAAEKNSVLCQNVPLLHSLAILSNTGRKTTDAGFSALPKRTEQPSDIRPFELNLINTRGQKEGLAVLKPGTKNMTGILLMISQGKRDLRKSFFFFFFLYISLYNVSNCA